MQIRQGDVLLVRVDDDPEHFREGRRHSLHPIPRERGRLVLAHGEVTGHAHIVESEEATLVTEEEAQALFLIVHGPDPVALVHEEHEALDIPPGAYRVVRQREYHDPEAWDEDWDFVAD